MRYQIEDSLSLVPGVGPIVGEHLNSMGIFSVGDLLRWYPRNYLFANKPVPIREIRTGLTEITLGKVHLLTKRRSKTGKPMLEVLFKDETGEITARWFYQAYLSQKLTPGSEWYIIGKFEYFHGQKVIINPILSNQPEVIPIYPQTKSISSNRIAKLIKEVLDKVDFPQTLPQEFQTDFNLVSTIDAINKIHQPETEKEALVAKNTLAKEEIFHFMLNLLKLNPADTQDQGIVLQYQLDFLQKVVKSLPFSLTSTQKKAIWEAVQELSSGKRMLRLLNGDVGSGKTVVGGILAVLLNQVKYKTILLAPTEVLAKQHYESLNKLFGQYLKLSLLTAENRLIEPETSMVVGTHALLFQKQLPEPVGLIIVDEQHRFGVEQRNQLIEKFHPTPHLLSMTATPIPRTLALTLFSNLDVSYLTDKPAERLPVKTKIIENQTDRTSMESLITQEIQSGHQVFIVCPTIKAKVDQENFGELTLFEPSEILNYEKKAVEEEQKNLSQAHPEWGEIGLLHGKQKPAQKEDIMRRYQAGEINVLVSTTVIEVGIDVPQASVIVIEGAESFGLASLHQLRGRVGRMAGLQGYCFLCPSKVGVQNKRRLQVLVESNDGFKIAEADLELRGPGDFSGVLQSGLPEFKFARLNDYQSLEEVRKWLELHLPDHKEWIKYQKYQAKTVKLG